MRGPVLESVIARTIRQARWAGGFFLAPPPGRAAYTRHPVRARRPQSEPPPPHPRTPPLSIPPPPQVEATQEQTRIVGLSATLPNYDDVAALLRVKPEK
jgi:hypothetical protein